MDFIFSIFGLSGKIPFHNDRSKICFNGAANSVKPNYLGIYVIDSWTFDEFMGEENFL